ncbi:MAG: hypothetical protein ACXVRK_06310 [Gaiellaceae bacterium]
MERGDSELIAEELSDIGRRVTALETQLSDVLMRLADAERVNARLESAALTTAKGLQEVSRHWDAVYEAMRRGEAPDQPEG